MEKKVSPDITQELLQRKLYNLKQNIHDINYIQQYINKQNRKKELKDKLKLKYDYSKNQVVDKFDMTEEELNKLDPDKVIFKFTSSFLE